MKNKRFVAIVTAIIMSSLVTGLVCWLAKLVGQQAIELFKAYAILTGSLCGVYQGVQSYTDKKKIDGGNNGDNRTS